MDKTNFKLGYLKANLCQFSTLIDSKVCPTGKIIKLEILGQKLIMSEVNKSAKLLLFMPATNAIAIIIFN